MTVMSEDIPPAWRHFLPAGLLLLASVIAIALLICQPVPGQRQLAVLLPPWDGPMAAAELVARAGGELVDGGGLPSVFIVTSDQPGFATALYRAGAWLVMNPITAHGCLYTPPPQGI